MSRQNNFKITLRLLCVLNLLCFANCAWSLQPWEDAVQAAQPTAKNNTEPSLKETSDWLIDALNGRHIFYRVEQAQTFFKLDYSFSPSDNRCDLHYSSTQIVSKDDGDGAITHKPHLELDLSKIAFRSLKCEPRLLINNRQLYFLHIPARSDDRFTGYDDALEGKRESLAEKEIQIQFDEDDKDLCLRTVKALQRAATLCGAKPELF